MDLHAAYILMVLSITPPTNGPGSSCFVYRSAESCNAALYGMAMEGQTRAHCEPYTAERGRNCLAVGQ
jgi:hypothetical protein